VFSFKNVRGKKGLQRAYDLRKKALKKFLKKKRDQRRERGSLNDYGGKQGAIKKKK